MIARQECAATVLGGPTAVIDLGGLRIVSDPTFDDPGPHGYLTKTAGPAVAEDQLGPVDLVLVSHDNHPDNLDDRGRALALAAPLVLTTRSGAGRLGPPAIGLAPWTSHLVPRPDGGDLTVTAVPAVHGPEDGERDADGFVNCEVIGFVLSGPDLPVVYVSGDNASIRTVAEIARRPPAIDAVVLHAGAARVPARFDGSRALSLDSVRAAAAAAILGPAAIIPAHYDGWTHFSEGRDDLVRAFDDAGLTAGSASPTTEPGSRSDPRSAPKPCCAQAAHGQVTGNGGCHHQGVVWSSMRSTHFTHQYPRRPGATRRGGYPCPPDRGAPPTRVASGRRPTSLTGKRIQYPVTECTSRLRACPVLRSRALTGTPLQSCREYQPEVQSRVVRIRAPNAESSSSPSWYWPAPSTTVSRH